VGVADAAEELLAGAAITECTRRRRTEERLSMIGVIASYA